MSLWEYKVISSGKGGFVSPILMEKFLNDLGKEDWEIVSFHTQPDNILAFTGLARRTTQRDWTLQDAAAAAAKTETDKLRAEFEAKFKNAAASSSSVEEKTESVLAEKAAPEDGFRKPRDTEHDHDPEAQEEEQVKDEWDKIGEEDELPSFFDAMKPHMRRNQRGAGMSVGVDYLAKKWDFSDADVIGALRECGFTVPDDEDAPVVYVEFDGDLFWININRRGELWINTKEKPRPVFRMVKAIPVVTPESESAPVEVLAPAPVAAAAERRRQDAPIFVPRPREQAKPAPKSEAATVVDAPVVTPGTTAPAMTPLPAGEDILNKVRPLMRRNRRGPGGSGSVGFLARGLRCDEADLLAAFTQLGILLPATANEEPVLAAIGEHMWWLNRDQQGGIWINGREKEPNEIQPSADALAAADAVPASAAPAASDPRSAASPPVAASRPASGQALSAVRLLLKETKTGSFAGQLDRVAGELNTSPGELLAAVVDAGLKVPEKAREKPVFVEHAGEIFWLNKNAKDELWLNAKASKFAGGDQAADAADGEKKSGRRPPRPRKKTE